MSEQNKATVIKFVEAMSNGDSAAADQCLAPGAFAVTKGFSNFTGTCERDTIVALVGTMKTLLPTGLRAKILNVIADGNSVAIEFEGNAVTSEGKPYCNQYCMMFTLENGLITRSHEYFCTKHAEEALWSVIEKAGFAPAPAQG